MASNEYKLLRDEHKVKQLQSILTHVNAEIKKAILHDRGIAK